MNLFRRRECPSVFYVILEKTVSLILASKGKGVGVFFYDVKIYENHQMSCSWSCVFGLAKMRVTKIRKTLRGSRRYPFFDTDIRLPSNKSS